MKEFTPLTSKILQNMAVGYVLIQWVGSNICQIIAVSTVLVCLQLCCFVVHWWHQYHVFFCSWKMKHQYHIFCETKSEEPTSLGLLAWYSRGISLLLLLRAGIWIMILHFGWQISYSVHLNMLLHKILS